MKLDWRLVDEPIDEDCDEDKKDLEYRKSVTCKVFLGFTSNLISSGVRDVVRYLCQHHMVSVFFWFNLSLTHSHYVFANLNRHRQKFYTKLIALEFIGLFGGLGNSTSLS